MGCASSASAANADPPEEEKKKEEPLPPKAVTPAADTGKPGAGAPPPAAPAAAAAAAAAAATPVAVSAPPAPAPEKAQSAGPAPSPKPAKKGACHEKKRSALPPKENKQKVSKSDSGPAEVLDAAALREAILRDTEALEDDVAGLNTKPIAEQSNQQREAGSSVASTPEPSSYDTYGGGNGNGGYNLAEPTPAPEPEPEPEPEKDIKALLPAAQLQFDNTKFRQAQAGGGGLLATSPNAAVDADFNDLLAYGAAASPAGGAKRPPHRGEFETGDGGDEDFDPDHADLDLAEMLDSADESLMKGILDTDDL